MKCIYHREMNPDKVIKSLDKDKKYIIMYFHGHDDVRLAELKPDEIVGGYYDGLYAVIDGYCIWMGD